MADVIQLLREFRRSSRSSVVTGIETAPDQDRPAIPHPMEAWLIELILDQLSSPHGPALSLIVLSGNAGDGKSYLMRQIRQRLREGEGLQPDMISWLLDATESRRPSERSVDRLGRFFAPFSDSASWRPDKLHVVAMNTGTAVRFFDHDAGRAEPAVLRTLSAVVNMQLGITGHTELESAPEFWTRFDRVLVIDLDRRMLFPLDSAEHTFLDQMLATLDPSSEECFLNRASPTCSECPLSAGCPVRANLTALATPRVRRRLNRILLDVVLEDRIHIGPRSLWHLVYQMTVGGLDSHAIATGAPLPTCAKMDDTKDEGRAGALFFHSLFESSAGRPEHRGVPLLGELRRVDPATRFTLDSHETALEASISHDEDLRLCSAPARFLATEPHVLSGPVKDPTARAAFALRRSFFFDEEEPDAVRLQRLTSWADQLAAHKIDVIKKREVRHDGADLLADVLRRIFAAPEHTDLWHLNLPWSAKTRLYVKHRVRPGSWSVPADLRVLGPDAKRPNGLRRMAIELIDALRVFPLAISVPLKDGPALRLTWPMFRLLQRVSNESYLPASLDPERVQHLERVGSSLGAQVAVSEGVGVLYDDRVRFCIPDENRIYDVIDE